MPIDPSTGKEPLPLRFVLTPPASLDEAIARSTAVTGRMIAQLWGMQRQLENCTVRIQGCLFGTAEQLWRQSLESCYLRNAPRSERINVA